MLSRCANLVYILDARLRDAGRETWDLSRVPKSRVPCQKIMKFNFVEQLLVEMRAYLDFDTGCNAFSRKVKEYRYEVCASLFFGLLAYGYYFTNMVYNHDSMNKIVLNGNHYYRLGRWGIDALLYLLPHPTMPWFDGFVSLFFYTFGICLVSSVFKLRNKYTRVLLAAVIISFPSFMDDYFYMYQAIYYALAFALAAAGVFLWANARNTWWLAGAVFCLLMLLGLYQGLLSVASSLMVVYLVRELVCNPNSAREAFRKGLVAIGVLVASVLLYALVTKLVFVIKGSGFSDYANNAMGDKSFSVRRLLLPYSHMVAELLFLRHNGSVVMTKFASRVHLAALLCCGFVVLRKMKGRTATDKAMLSLLLFIYPLSVNFMYLATDPGAVHTLVHVGFLSIYVLMAVVLEQAERHVMLSNVAKVSLCFIIIVNVRISNEAAMQTSMLVHHATSVHTSIVTQIKLSGMLDGKSKLAILGKTDQFLHDLTKDYPHWRPHVGLGVNNYSRQNFMRYFLGFDIPAASVGEMKKIVATDEFKDMPIYPYEGSIRKFGDVIVVKFSEEVEDIH